MTTCKPAIIVFPGTNCDQDVDYALRMGFNCKPVFLWHTNETIPKDITHVIIPGGFSYGDYLRAGAMAKESPIMKAVLAFAQEKRVLGICNGFQILCEIGLIPGVLLRNQNDRFVCRMEPVSWLGMSQKRSAIKLTLPIAHREGRFYASGEVIRKLSGEGLIAMTYERRDEFGRALVNGSLGGIAGIVAGLRKNILGIMPHPERALEKDFLGCDGRLIFEDFLFG